MTWKPDYVTSAQLKNYVKISDTDDDTQVALAVTAASRAVDRACNRQFGQTATAEDRYFTPEWVQSTAMPGFWRVEIDDIMDKTGMTVAFDETGDWTYSTVLTQYRLLEQNAPSEGKPWTSLQLGPTNPFGTGGSNIPFFFYGRARALSVQKDSFKIHVKWGWTSFPDTIVNATLLQGSRFLSRRESPYGVAGSPEAGTEIRLLPKVDPDVALMVRPYARLWGVR